MGLKLIHINERAPGGRFAKKKCVISVLRNARKCKYFVSWSKFSWTMIKIKSHEFVQASFNTQQLTWALTYDDLEVSLGKGPLVELQVQGVIVCTHTEDCHMGTMGGRPLIGLPQLKQRGQRVIVCTHTEHCHMGTMGGRSLTGLPQLKQRRQRVIGCTHTEDCHMGPVGGSLIRLPQLKQRGQRVISCTQTEDCHMGPWEGGRW